MPPAARRPMMRNSPAKVVPGVSSAISIRWTRESTSAEDVLVQELEDVCRLVDDARADDRAALVPTEMAERSELLERVIEPERVRLEVEIGRSLSGLEERLFRHVAAHAVGRVRSVVVRVVELASGVARLLVDGLILGRVERRQDVVGDRDGGRD